MISMEGPRGARTDEFEEVIELINHVFRISRQEKPTMKFEFPLLLNKNNVENMRIMKIENQLVSTVNFMKHEILIEGVPIVYGAVGAVCTHEDYERKGYSSKILDNVELCMEEQGIDICLISGTRSLYTRRKAMTLPSFKRYDILASQQDLDFIIDEYSHSDLDDIFSMYHKKETRYKRSLAEMKVLIDGATHSWGSFTYARHVLKRQGKIIGYIMLRMINADNGRHGLVVECSGQPDSIYKALSYLAYENKLSHIEYHVHVKDALNHLDDELEPEIDNQQGTIKIINYERFMRNLVPYFEKFINQGILDQLTFSAEVAEEDDEEKEEKYTLAIGGERIQTSDSGEITNLLFAVDGADAFVLNDKPRLKKIVEMVFPLPMPWTMNLNYQ